MFKQRPLSLSATIHAIFTELGLFSMASGTSHSGQVVWTNQIGRLLHWSSHLLDSVKVNVDASWIATEAKCHVGIVILDGGRLCLKVGWVKMATSSVIMEKAWAIKGELLRCCGGI